MRKDTIGTPLSYELVSSQKSHQDLLNSMLKKTQSAGKTNDKALQFHMVIYCTGMETRQGATGDPGCSYRALFINIIA